LPETAISHKLSTDKFPNFYFATDISGVVMTEKEAMS